MRSAIANPFFPLLLFSISLCTLYSAYVTLGTAPSAELEVIVAFLWSMLLPMWMVSDARRRDGVPCYDFGMFVYVFLPLSVPWYCLWSRGWRGLATLVMIIAVFVLPYVTAAIVWEVLYANPR